MIYSKSALALALVIVGNTAGVYAQTQPHCGFAEPFDTTVGCESPATIGLSGSCGTLPDCPSWCNPDPQLDPAYCPAGTSVIAGSGVPKYEMEFFLPPVLVNSNEGKGKGKGKDKGAVKANNAALFQNNVAVREFLQQILPPAGTYPGYDSYSGYPKTRVWGYGDPNFSNSFHNPAASIEAKKDLSINIAFLNDLVADPDTCRCSEDLAVLATACKPLEHILKDCAGVQVVDTKLHWANPGGPDAATDPRMGLAECAELVGESNSFRTDCTGKNTYVYDGPIPNVAHVHGTHAKPESDGYTEAWFLPKNSGTGASGDGYTPGGNFFDTFAPTFIPKNVCNGPETDMGTGFEANTYRNDQTTSTLFFHDHSLGMTRLNVMATSAGFYFIRDETCLSKRKGFTWYGESGMDCTTNTLPGPPPTAELNKGKNWNIKPPNSDMYVRELPIAIQDMSFYVDGAETRQFYPANRDHFNGLDGERWGCNNLYGNSAYQNALPPLSPIWNPEVFFDVAVVNGHAWPKHEVRPNRYRLRLLNACDSRTLSLSAWKWNGQDPPIDFNDLFTNSPGEIPIWVLGTEQSLLPYGPAKILSTGGNGDGFGFGSVTKFTDCATTRETSTDITPSHQGLLMQPGERYDALIDFTGLDFILGTPVTQVYIVNTGPNEPFKTFDLIDQTVGELPPGDGLAKRAPFNTLGQILRFDVSLDAGIEDSTSPDKLCFDAFPGGVEKFPPGFERTVYLKEELTTGEALGPFAAVLDNELDNAVVGKGFDEGKGWAKPITEIIPINRVEDWNIVNLSGK
mmetsp:Transcript_27204/g.58280  ORF Transcript_27204/g.58280 Transcript_27204/m.58280 type:complete len:796 (-) Transcript_27204:1505-3892(-)